MTKIQMCHVQILFIQNVNLFIKILYALIFIVPGHGYKIKINTSSLYLVISVVCRNNTMHMKLTV